MSHLLSFDLTAEPVLGDVTDLVGYLESRAVAMGSCRDARGRIRRAEVCSVVEHGLRSGGFSAGAGVTLAAKELDFTHPSGIAVSIQAGRAAANHGALFAVLAAAASPPVDWLVLAVPAVYKGPPSSIRYSASSTTCARAPASGSTSRASSSSETDSAMS